MDLTSMWDNVLSMVTEGVDFELLPMTSESEEPQSPFSLPSDVAGGPPAPFFFDGGARVAADGEETEEPMTPLEECDGPGGEFEGGPFLNGASKNAPLSLMTAGGPPPPPPPGPPPPPKVAKVDPHTEAKQMMKQLIMRIRGGNDSKRDLKKKEESGSSTDLDYDELNEKGKQWADFNARGHKLKDGREFIEVANRKRRQIDQQLKSLKEKTDEELYTLKELESAAEILGTAGDWYQGGVKDLKPEGKNSLYEQLEKVIEAMVEFFTLRKEMTELPYQYQCDGELQDVLSKTKVEFESRHKRLGAVIISGAQAWRRYKFPVCERLQWKSHGYLCGLVVTFVKGSLDIASKVDTSKANQRTSQARVWLEESMQLLKQAAPYFSLKQGASDEEVCSCEACEGAENGTSLQNGHQTFLQDDLLKLTVRVAETYFQLGISQFEGYVNKMGKQKICEHFQSILGLLKKVEEMVNSLPRDETDSGPQRKKTAAGVVTRLPESEGLKETMSRSCQSLCGHVGTEAKKYRTLTSDKESDAKQEKTKEMVQWMSFYCKYSYQMSTASGTLLADHEKTAEITVCIALSFIEDNLKQYDSFVRVLDGKRIRAHFDRIMKMINSLVSNLPTNGGATSEKLLKALPGSDKLITTVIKSCDCLVEHYQNHEQNTIERLQATDVEPSTLKKRKEEVTKWLAFGGEYLHEMLNALGPDHTATLMGTLVDFKQVVSSVEEVSKNIKV